MEGFGLLLGHLFGDYIFQPDVLAANKATPVVLPEWPHTICRDAEDVDDALDKVRRCREQEEAAEAQFYVARRRGHLACTVHCLWYTIAVWLFSFWWMPWWGLLVCFLTHWPVDRFRLAGRLMRNVLGQRQFASGPLSPWSGIVIDNTLHLAVLFLIGVSAGR